MKFMKGRQNSGYLKLKLFCFSRFDCWILKYPEQSHIPPHVDSTPFGKPIRINIILKNPKIGGIFTCKKSYYVSKYLNIFNPSFEHSVSKIEKGSRYVLSIGFLI